MQARCRRTMEPYAQQARAAAPAWCSTWLGGPCLPDYTAVELASIREVLAHAEHDRQVAAEVRFLERCPLVGHPDVDPLRATGTGGVSKPPPLVPPAVHARDPVLPCASDDVEAPEVRGTFGPGQEDMQER